MEDRRLNGYWPLPSGWNSRGNERVRRKIDREEEAEGERKVNLCARLSLAYVLPADVREFRGAEKLGSLRASASDKKCSPTAPLQTYHSSVIPAPESGKDGVIFPFNSNNHLLRRLGY